MICKELQKRMDINPAACKILRGPKTVAMISIAFTSLSMIDWFVRGPPKAYTLLQNNPATHLGPHAKSPRPQIAQFRLLDKSCGTVRNV